MFRPTLKIFLILALLLCVLPALAKRTAPPFILPVDDGIYRFVVRENGQPDKKHVYKGGHVVAYLKVTGDMVWERYLYKVKLDTQVEEDVQNVYIQQMYLEDPDRLVIQNERGEWFVLDRRNGRSLMVDKFKRKALEKEEEEDDEDVTQRAAPLLQGNYLIVADPGIIYGRQKLSAYDVPTGRLLWEKKISNPKNASGDRSHISLMILNDRRELELSFEDGAHSKLDARTGKALR
jgi:outer membrane protein assembly factor BamB